MYNNEKTCPFADICVFLHQDARFCKYDERCERDMCMFKHRKKNVPLNEDNEIFEIGSDYDDDRQLRGEERNLR